MEEGLRILAEVKRQVGVPVLTDVHAEDEIAEVAAVVDVLQTPAFLCRQTDFIHAVAAAGKPVNIKKGQFLAPEDMKQVVDKARDGERRRQHPGLRARRVLRLPQPRLRHALARDHARDRLPGRVRCDALGAASRAGRARPRGGQREFVPVLARAAVAAGVAGVFMETHPDPAQGAVRRPECVAARTACASCWRRWRSSTRPSSARASPEDDR